jgi:protein involved in polysaccharide export with SLBB domain
VFTLDWPVTIVEAIAQAGGFQTSTVEQHTFEMVDLSRSFLVRDGEPVSINFEQLFKHGDLGQNIALQPNDYLYFPPLNLPEIYVLGSVASPGIAAFTENASLLRAITRSGGFTPEAYKQKVLVIRGSLNRPETFVVDAKSILDAEAPDFKLQARDIVYVNDRPWIKAEELLDTAANAFIRAAVVGWTGQNIGPFITEPVIE